MTIHSFDDHKTPNFGKCFFPMFAFPDSYRLCSTLSSRTSTLRPLWLRPEDFENLIVVRNVAKTATVGALTLPHLNAQAPWTL